MRQTLRCGWPTQWTTGPDPFAVLTTYPGPYPFRMRANTTYQNLVINGCVLVEGDNSVLRNYIVRPTAATLCGGAMAIDAERATPLSGVRFEQGEVDLANAGANRFNLRAISGDGFTLDRVRCVGGGDCVHYGGDIVIRDSLFDVPQCVGTVAFCSSLHIDALHSSPGHPDPAKRRVWIEHNTVIVRGSDVGINATSAIINGPDLVAYGSPYPQSDVHVVNNMLGGGQYTVYCEAHWQQASSRPMAEFRGNRVTDLLYPRGGYYGATTDCAGGPAGPAVPGYETNVWDATGLPLPAVENPRVG